LDEWQKLIPRPIDPGLEEDLMAKNDKRSMDRIYICLLTINSIEEVFDIR
jgi:hypothetical protein